MLFWNPFPLHGHAEILKVSTQQMFGVMCVMHWPRANGPELPDLRERCRGTSFSSACGRMGAKQRHLDYLLLLQAWAILTED